DLGDVSSIARGRRRPVLVHDVALPIAVGKSQLGGRCVLQADRLCPVEQSGAAGVAPRRRPGAAWDDSDSIPPASGRPGPAPGLGRGHGFLTDSWIFCPALSMD